MDITIGAVLQGKVTGITKFGAFVSLPENKTGLVHISEISHTYVNDVREHLEDGQEVSVKILSIEPGGRMNLSIKKAAEPSGGKRQGRPGQGQRRPAAPVGPLTFEDKLKLFMADSESKMSDLRQHGDRKRR